MRVLVITTGCDRSEKAIFEGLISAGIRIDMLATPKTSYQEALSVAGVRIYSQEIRHRLDFRAVRRVQSLIQNNRYDIVYAPNNKSLSVGLLASRGMKIKHVGYRGTVGHLSRWDPASRLTYFHPRLDHIVCVSNAVRNYLLSVGIPSHRLTTIYKGHDIEWYNEAPPAGGMDFDVPQDAFVVGFIGNMRPVKGIPVLLASLRYIPKQIPIYLVCIGRVEDRRINRLMRDPRIGANTRMPGFLPRASALVKTFDCLVMPSVDREGLPRAVIEAMAQEVPVVVSDAGGMPELVRDGHSGLVVPARDSQALARALMGLHEDPQRCRRFGKNGRTRIKEIFNIQTTIAEFIGLFGRL